MSNAEKGINNINFDDLISEVIEKKKLMETNGANLNEDGAYLDEYTKLIQLEKSLVELKNKFLNLENNNLLLDEKVLDIHSRLDIIEKEIKNKNVSSNENEKTRKNVLVNKSGQIIKQEQSKKINEDNDHKTEDAETIVLQTPKNIKEVWLKIENDKDQEKIGLQEKLEYVNAKDGQLQDLTAKMFLLGFFAGIQVIFSIGMWLLIFNLFNRDISSSEIANITSSFVENLKPIFGMIIVGMLTVIFAKFIMTFFEYRERITQNKKRLIKLGYK